MKKRKKSHKNSHLRRLFLGSRMEFDGNESAGQNAVFANGSRFGLRDIDFIIENSFKWSIAVVFEFKSGNFTRSHSEEFIAGPCRFNELKDYANEMATKAGLGMPEGYVFNRNTWKAKVVG